MLMRHTRLRKSEYVLIALIAILLVAHQWDWGFKADQLVLGVMPYELLNQIIISLAAAAAWWFAACFAWPRDLEHSVPEDPSAASQAGDAMMTDSDI